MAKAAKSTTKAATAAATPAAPAAATTAAPAAAPAATTAAPVTKAEPVAKITANGVTRPKDGTTTGRVWAIADEISAKQQRPATRKEVIDQVHAEAINTSTGATQYGKWRKFFGLVGDEAPGRTAKPEAPAVAPAGAVEGKTAPVAPVAPAAAS